MLHECWYHAGPHASITLVHNSSARQPEDQHLDAAIWTSTQHVASKRLQDHLEVGRIEAPATWKCHKLHPWQPQGTNQLWRSSPEHSAGCQSAKTSKRCLHAEKKQGSLTCYLISEQCTPNNGRKCVDHTKMKCSKRSRHLTKTQRSETLFLLSWTSLSQGTWQRTSIHLEKVYTKRRSFMRGMTKKNRQREKIARQRLDLW